MWELSNVGHMSDNWVTANNDLSKMWKETVVAEFSVLFQLLSGSTVERPQNILGKLVGMRPDSSGGPPVWKLKVVLLEPIS